MKADAVRFSFPHKTYPAFFHAASASSTRVTPVMEQYIEIKAANPDCLLFYRMGDFYELFFEDAEVASRALGIVLTKRGKHLGRDIPMCGVPIHRADEYLHRLIALGHRVAVCEQLEDPAEARKRGGKSVVRRDVVRLVTPGTLTEDTLLDARRNNYLLAIARARGSSARRRRAASRSPGSTSRPANSASPSATAPGLAGRDRAARAGRDHRLGRALRRRRARALPALAAGGDAAAARRVRRRDRRAPARRLFRASPAREAFGALTRLELTAAAACITYVERTQLGKRPPLSPPVREAQGATLAIDQATRANLELMRTLVRRAARLAARRHRPHRDAGGLAAAGAAAGGAAHRSRGDRAAARRGRACSSRTPAPRGDVRERLKAAPDLARALARLVVGRGGPRDLAAIRDGIAAAASLAGALDARGDAAGRDRAGRGRAAPARRRRSRPSLRAALADELPHLKRDGGFVRAGYDAGARRGARAARRIAPRDRGAAGALRRDDRRARR